MKFSRIGKNKIKSTTFALIIALISLASITPASAWPTSGMVILQGKIQPNYYSINNCVKSLSVTTPSGQFVGVGLGSGCYPSYSYAYTNVPTSGFKVNYVITFSSGLKKSGSFGLNRPINTYYATVNLY